MSTRSSRPGWRGCSRRHPKRARPARWKRGPSWRNDATLGEIAKDEYVTKVHGLVVHLDPATPQPEPIVPDDDGYETVAGGAVAVPTPRPAPEPTPQPAPEPTPQPTPR